MTFTTTQICLMFAGYMVFMCGTQAMKDPTPEQDSGFYGWLYRFLNLLSCNLDRAAHKRFPAMPAFDGGAQPDVAVQETVQKTTTVTTAHE